jgi:ketosteroid isomerase-like protein
MSASTRDLPSPRPAEANADVVRRGYHAFSTGDIHTLNELFDVRSAWHTPGRSLVAGDHQGREAVLAQFARYGGETHGTFRAALRDVLANDDGCVVALHHNSGRRNGRRLDVDCCVEFFVRDGKIISGREYFFDLHAWDAFWAA